MSNAEIWRIPAEARDWECDWEGDELFHLRYFRALSLPEKIRAVEGMEQVAAYFARRSPGAARGSGEAAGGR
jgi:hypothetical protein